MKAALIRIGNSRGIRLPKPVIELCGLGDEVELEVRNHQVVISSADHPREGWDEAFASMHEHGDDRLLDRAAETATEWDREEWEW